MPGGCLRLPVYGRLSLVIIGLCAVRRIPVFFLFELSYDKECWIWRKDISRVCLNYKILWPCCCLLILKIVHSHNWCWCICDQYLSNCNIQLWVCSTGVDSDWSWIEKYFKKKRSVTSYKSSDTAAELRTTGNKHFQKKDFNLALQYYNQVV